MPSAAIKPVDAVAEQDAVGERSYRPLLFVRTFCSVPVPHPPPTLGCSTRKNLLASAGRTRYRKYTVEFEFDPAKSKANLEKHGIDFEAAQALWADEDRLIIPARSDTEERFALLGRFGDRVWAAFYTMRGEAVRIVSVRRARDNEIELYES